MIRRIRLIRLIRPIFLLSLIGLIGPIAVSATDSSSTNFTVKDPVIEELGGFSSSTNFQVRGSIPYISPTRGTSTNFAIKPGFLAYGNPVLPVLSAVAGPGQISLSWTDAEDISGATYEVGMATNVSGCCYTYDSHKPPAALNWTDNELRITLLFG